MAKTIAKPKAPKANELALTKAAPDVMAQIVSIANLADPYGDKPVANVTLENLPTAVEVLARVREAIRKLDDVYSTAVKGLQDKLKPYTVERKALKDRLLAADEAVATRLIELYREAGADNAMERKSEGPLGSSMSVVHKGWTVTVDNADLIPDEYITPPAPREKRVNVAAITAMIDAGMTIPGVTATKNYYLTTRAAETIKMPK